MAADKRNAAGNSCSRCWTSLPTPGATHILPTQLTGRWEDVVAVSRPAQAGTDIRRKSSVKTSSGRRQLRRMSRASEDDVTFRRNGGGGRRSRLRMRDGMSPIFCPGQRGPATPGTSGPEITGEQKLNAEGEGIQTDPRPTTGGRPPETERLGTWRGTQSRPASAGAASLLIGSSLHRTSAGVDSNHQTLSSESSHLSASSRLPPRHGQFTSHLPIGCL